LRTGPYPTLFYSSSRSSSPYFFPTVSRRCFKVLRPHSPILLVFLFSGSGFWYHRFESLLTFFFFCSWHFFFPPPSFQPIESYHPPDTRPGSPPRRTWQSPLTRLPHLMFRISGGCRRSGSFSIPGSRASPCRLSLFSTHMAPHRDVSVPRIFFRFCVFFFPLPVRIVLFLMITRVWRAASFFDGRVTHDERDDPSILSYRLLLLLINLRFRIGFFVLRTETSSRIDTLHDDFSPFFWPQPSLEPRDRAKLRQFILLVQTTP